MVHRAGEDGQPLFLHASSTGSCFAYLMLDRPIPRLCLYQCLLLAWDEDFVARLRAIWFEAGKVGITDCNC